MKHKVIFPDLFALAKAPTLEKDIRCAASFLLKEHNGNALLLNLIVAMAQFEYETTGNPPQSVLFILNYTPGSAHTEMRDAFWDRKMDLRVSEQCKKALRPYASLSLEEAWKITGGVDGSMEAYLEIFPFTDIWPRDPVFETVDSYVEMLAEYFATKRKAILEDAAMYGVMKDFYQIDDEDRGRHGCEISFCNFDGGIANVSSWLDADNFRSVLYLLDQVFKYGPSEKLRKLEKVVSDTAEHLFSVTEMIKHSEEEG